MTTNQRGQDRPAPTSARQTTDPRLARVAQVAQQVATDGKVPGLAFAVASITGTSLSGGTGFADLSTQRPCEAADHFPWFSMTRIATASAAMRLHEQAVLDVDKPIDTYLDHTDQVRRAVTNRHGTPTLRQLLNHTAGLPNPLPMRWVQPADQPADPLRIGRLLTKHGSPRRQPGVRAGYSNISYLLAGHMLEQITGSTVESLVQHLVLDPAASSTTSTSRSTSGQVKGGSSRFDSGSPAGSGRLLGSRSRQVRISEDVLDRSAETSKRKAKETPMETNNRNTMCSSLIETGWALGVAVASGLALLP